MEYLSLDYFSEQLKTLKEKASEQVKEISIAHSEIDKEVSKLYHQIEFSKFNACTGYHLAKKLKDALTKRRIVKQHYGQIQSLNDKLSKMIPENNK